HEPAAEGAARSFATNRLSKVSHKQYRMIFNRYHNDISRVKRFRGAFSETAYGVVFTISLMKPIRGLHHVTAIAGPAQENLDFYVGVLGLRLVKKSVNQDDPGTYHLFYADAEGHPGTDITFFPWADLAPSREGYGMSSEVALAVPPGSLDFWKERLAKSGVQVLDIEVRFGERTLPLADPHGLRIALVESQNSLARTFAPWKQSPIPAEHQIRGLETARLVEHDLEDTLTFLSDGMGFTKVGEERGWM